MEEEQDLSTAEHTGVAKHHLSRSLLLTMAAASGVAVANLYYNQPMLADMARTFNVNVHQIGLVATATQVGYAAGMPLFIPLGDFIERRRLLTMLFAAVACALAGAALSTSLTALIIASFLIGVVNVIAQIMIPLGSELAAPEEQGRTIGTIISGLLLGILLARTLSGIVSQHFGWRPMYWIAAALAVLFAVIVRLALPAIPCSCSCQLPAADEVNTRFGLARKTIVADCDDRRALLLRFQCLLDNAGFSVGDSAVSLR